MLGIKLQLQHKGGEDVSSFVTTWHGTLTYFKMENRMPRMKTTWALQGPWKGSSYKTDLLVWFEMLKHKNLLMCLCELFSPFTQSNLSQNKFFIVLIHLLFLYGIIDHVAWNKADYVMLIQLCGLE